MAKAKEQPTTLAKNDLFAVVNAGIQQRQQQKVVSTGLSTSPYVQFLHNAAKNYRNVLTALGNLADGTPVLVNNDEYTLLNPFEFLFVPSWFQYYGRSDGQGEILEILDINSGRKPDGIDWAEFVEAVLILVLPNNVLQPARIRYRGPKIPAFRAAHASWQDDCCADDWSARSKAHKAQKDTGMPTWSWLLHTATMTNKIPKKPGSRPYDQCDSTSKMTPPSVLAMLKRLATQAEFAESMQACITDHNNRVKDLQNLGASK